MNKCLRTILKNTLTLFTIAANIVACNSNNSSVKCACIDVNVIKGGKLIKIDSCFTASTSDSLDLMISHVRQKQKDTCERYETRLLIIIIDTLQKLPKDYEYALVTSEAGIINSEVIITHDPETVIEKSALFNKGSIHAVKLRSQGSLKNAVEETFKKNIRINYRRVENVKINS